MTLGILPTAFRNEAKGRRKKNYFRGYITPCPQKKAKSMFFGQRCLSHESKNPQMSEKFVCVGGVRGLFSGPFRKNIFVHLL